MVNGDQLQRETNTPDNPQLSKQGLFSHQRVPFGGCPQALEGGVTAPPRRFRDRRRGSRVPPPCSSPETHTRRRCEQSGSPPAPPEQPRTKPPVPSPKMGSDAAEADPSARPRAAAARRA